MTSGYITENLIRSVFENGNYSFSSIETKEDGHSWSLVISSSNPEEITKKLNDLGLDYTKQDDQKIITTGQIIETRKGDFDETNKENLIDLLQSMEKVLREKRELEDQFLQRQANSEKEVTINLIRDTINDLEDKDFITNHDVAVIEEIVKMFNEDIARD